ncbi:MAG: MFS transporter [Candidatus Hydrogenedentes bacterium]|nr:MFS transporter [Candidatus Hydrogenedentota bacterium]
MSHDKDTFAEKGNKALFWACFLSLIATAFGFIIRSMVIGDWQVEFDLTETQKGEILGVGLWPFALSIVLFSLIIDNIGYGRAMGFAFACHLISAIMTIFATGYQMLYWATFIAALGNGTVEAVINPVVATMFHRDKTKWLNILHAGWPGGLVLGGLLTILLTTVGFDSWQYKFSLVFIPVIGYGILMLGKKFPVHERVEAGVSYKSMLQELGFFGALIIVSLMVYQVGALPATPPPSYVLWAIILVISIGFGVYVQSLGRPLFIFLALIMMPLATTELGTDTWISTLMEPEMTKLGLQAGWVLVYTSFVMMCLRFMAGHVVERISPLGLLACSATIAILGLTALSKSSGIGVLLAATLYAFGKTFFWPTMLGVVAERFPKGGALTMNTIAGVGMLSVGIVGAPFLGFFQDAKTASSLEAYDQANQTALVSTYTVSKNSIFGEYNAVDPVKIAESTDDAQKATITELVDTSKKAALQTVAIFPAIMLVCYLALILYFRSQGGYKVVHITDAHH